MEASSRRLRPGPEASRVPLRRPLSVEDVRLTQNPPGAIDAGRGSATAATLPASNRRNSPLFGGAHRPEESGATPSSSHTRCGLAWTGWTDADDSPENPCPPACTEGKSVEHTAAGRLAPSRSNKTRAKLLLKERSSAAGRFPRPNADGMPPTGSWRNPPHPKRLPRRPVERHRRMEPRRAGTPLLSTR